MAKVNSKTATANTVKTVQTAATAVKNAAAATVPTAKLTWQQYQASQLKKQEILDEAKELQAQLKKAASKRPGVIVSILSIIEHAEKPVTQAQILEEMVKLIPTRKESSMLSTIKAQLNNKMPMRMEIEKRVAISTEVSKHGVKSYKFEARFE